MLRTAHSVTVLHLRRIDSSTATEIIFMFMCNSPFFPVQLHHMFHISAYTVVVAAFRCNAEAGYGPLYRS